MKAVVVQEFGDPSVLGVREVPEPRSGSDDVLLEVAHAGVNYADTMLRRDGIASFSPTLPFVPGFEAVGVVAETGRENASDRVRGATVRVGDPGGVHLQSCRAAAAMAEAAGDGADVYASRDEFSGGVVAEGVQALATELEPLCEASEALASRPGSQGNRTVRGGSEDEGFILDVHAESRAQLGPLLLQGGQHLDRYIVECDAATLMCLGGLHGLAVGVWATEIVRRDRSRSDQRSAHISPRREPVVIVSQRNKHHSGSSATSLRGRPPPPDWVGRGRAARTLVVGRSRPR